MPELLIRAAFNDHHAVADLLAPRGFPESGRGSSRPVSRVVLNATDAARRSHVSDLAGESGTPVLVDPLTMLLQVNVDPKDAWSRHVPYAREQALEPETLANPFLLDSLAASCLEFQVEHGASAIIPPYFYAESPDDPAFDATVAALSHTARRMRGEGVSLPLVPLLCAQVQGFTRRQGWQKALDRFAVAAAEIGPQALALCLSPVGDGRESYSKLLALLTAARHLGSSGVPVFAWRQGVYGPALVAAGLGGYECGMGVSEQSQVRTFMRARRPRQRESKPFAANGVYFPSLGRSVSHKFARVLLDDRRLRGRLVCASSGCCPHGAESMLSAKGRVHAVRSRARELLELAEMPSDAWRLHHIAKTAAGAQVTAMKANEVLAAAGVSIRVHTEGYESLQQVADFLRTHGTQPSARDSA